MATNPNHGLYPSQAARERFGLTLTIWLERGGWTHDIPLRWAKDAGFMSVADSTFNRLQRGKIEQPYPITFIQLALLNERLFRQEYDLPDDHPLMPRLKSQQPIQHDDGSLWRATDFFSHFIGELSAPSWALKPSAPTEAQARKISAAITASFHSLAQQMDLSLPEAWDSLVEQLGRMDPPPLDAAELKVLRNVLSGWHSWTPEQLVELYDADAQLRPDLLIDAWARHDDRLLASVP